MSAPMTVFPEPPAAGENRSPPPLPGQARADQELTPGTIMITIKKIVDTMSSFTPKRR